MSELTHICEEKIQTWFVSPLKSKHLFEHMYLVKRENGFILCAWFSTGCHTCAKGREIKIPLA